MNRRTSFRLAQPDDYSSVVALDSAAPHDPRRSILLQEWIGQRSCHLLLLDGVPAAYGVLHHHFFDSGFIDMLMVGEPFRRRGLGALLLQHLVAQCERPKLFSSTNQSNRPMRALFQRCGFVESGSIDNLDPGDAEVVYFRAACPG